MSKIGRIVLVALLVVMLGGMVFMATWEIPPPTTRVERVIPNDQFPR